MTAAPASPETFAIVGAGRIGAALGVLLQRAGHRVAAASARTPASRERAARLLGCPVTADPGGAAAAAGRVIVAVPDDALGAVAGAIAAGVRPGTLVAHTAGSLGPEALAPVQAAGGRALAVHPLQSVPDVSTGLARLPGSWYGVTCDDDLRPWAAGLVAALGGRPMWVAPGDRVRYHTTAVIASNFLVTLAALVERVWGTLDPYLPLMGATLANVEALGPAGALTGPVVRADASTLGHHLALLHGTDGGAEAAYRAMAAETVRLAEGGGRIAPAEAAGLRRLLEAVP